jgi:hypothetical protein
MFEHYPNLIAFRGCMVAVCLALLAGCLPRTTNPAAPVPAGLAVTAGDAVATLTWTASMGATGYNVKRSSTKGGPYTTLASATAPTYTDSSVKNGTTYYYVVSALNIAGESANSTEVSASPKAPSAPPPVPIDLAAAAGDKAITLTWTASSGASTYNVKRSTTNGGPYTQIAASTSTTYVDAPLTNGTTYYYVVSSVNSFGESANSAQISASPSPPPPDTFGTWVNVTPSNADLTTAFACGNFGATTATSDPLHPSDIYTEFNCQGIWKSTDYGATWTGPINTGSNGAAVGDCSGGVTISPNNTAGPAIVYETCIRGAGLGFWKSVDGGVNWTQYQIATTSRQDYSGPAIDPYDQNHLLLVAHEFDSVVESVDGGQNWSSVPLADGMLTTSQSGSISFVDTGNASGTRGTWLWIGRSGGFGTWRTSNGGATWVQVDKNESGGGVFQPDTNGVVYMPGINSALGNGVLRSNDYGQTWAHVGLGGAEAVVFGTSKNVYAMFGAAIGPSGSIGPNFEVASQPGTGTWVAPGTPPGLADGAAAITVVNDGTHNIFVGAMFNSGVWRYVEP